MRKQEEHRSSVNITPIELAPSNQGTSNYLQQLPGHGGSFKHRFPTVPWHGGGLEVNPTVLEHKTPTA